MVMTTFWSVSQLGCLPGEVGCHHKTAPGFTDIADDALAKGDSGINYDVAIFSLLKIAQKQQPKIQCSENTVQDEGMQVLWAATNPGVDEY